MQAKVRRGVVVAVGTALAFGVAAFLGAGTVSVSAQEECHYAYGGCLPYVDDLDYADIGWAVVEVWDVNDDPYEMDVLDWPGSGWTCDGVE